MGLSATYSNAQGNTLPIVWGTGSTWGPDWENAKRPDWIPLHERFFNPFDSGDRSEKPSCETCGICALG
jgi:hypothetical protein